MLEVCAATGAIAGLETLALGRQKTTYRFGGGEGAGNPDADWNRDCERDGDCDRNVGRNRDWNRDAR